MDVAGAEVEAGLNRTTVSRALAEGHDFDRTYRGYDYAGALRCTDGWVAVRPVEERQWQGLCGGIGRPDLVEDPRFANRLRRYDNADGLTGELEAWTRTHSREQVRAVLLAAGCPGGPFLSPGDVLADKAIGSRELFGEIDLGGMAPVRGWHRTRSSAVDPPVWPAQADPALPLQGLRVIDLTWVAAGPYATELLAFLGAEVVRVESASRPDIFRRSQDNPGCRPGLLGPFHGPQPGQEVRRPRPEGTRGLPGSAGHGRDRSRGRRELPARRPRSGWAWAMRRLHAVNPALVILALSGFGPQRWMPIAPDMPAFSTPKGASGWMTGYPDAPPSDVRDTNDLRGGTLGALAVVGALLEVATDGVGAVVDVATRDALVVLQGHLALRRVPRA